jgi:hypothetical protein
MATLSPSADHRQVGRTNAATFSIPGNAYRMKTNETAISKKEWPDTLVVGVVN